VEDSGWEPNGLTHPVRFYEGGGTYPLRGFPPLLSKTARCVRCGGSWKRGYGTTYTGTKGGTLHTDKAGPSGLPRQLSTLPGYFCVTVGQMTEEMIEQYLEHHFEPRPNDDFKMEPD